MKITINEKQSPNSSSRKGEKIDVIVLHCTAGALKPSIDWLCNPKSKVSSHYVVSKDGTVYQLLSEDVCAWHAGRATFEGKPKVNERSIGIEIENDNKGESYPEAQIYSIVELCRDIRRRYEIPEKNIVGHRDVAPKRKTDPVDFPWEKFFSALRFSEGENNMSDKKYDQLGPLGSVGCVHPGTEFQASDSGRSPIPNNIPFVGVDWGYPPQIKKPGYKSTEFWAMLGINVAALLGTVQEVLPPTWASVVMTVSTSIYMVCRAFVKR